jgi:hypothetical protein
VSYIDAGYAAGLGVLAVYAGLLWYRRRRLEHLAAQVDGLEGERHTERAEAQR